MTSKMNDPTPQQLDLNAWRNEAIKSRKMIAEQARVIAAYAVWMQKYARWRKSHLAESDSR